MRLFKFVELILFILLLIIGINSAIKKRGHSYFQINVVHNEPKQVYSHCLIPEPKTIKFSHSATITKLSNGDLLALWFGGSREGHPDVKIWQSRYHNGKWQLAHSVMSSNSLINDLDIYISKLGNPVVYRAKNGILHLFVVSVSIGGWGGSSINHLTSLDNGVSWSKAKKIITSPFLNISSLVRSSPVELSDGGFYLPIYHEFLRTYPAILYFDADGQFVEQKRMVNFNTLLQPSIINIDSTTAYAYMRNNGRKNRVLYRLETHDGGETWGNLTPTNLENFDSSIAVSTFESNLLIIIYNDKTRRNLSISSSLDGIIWQPRKILEQYKGSGYAEFSYPSIVKSAETINTVYTWYITGSPHLIKYIAFNKKWLESNNI